MDESTKLLIVYVVAMPFLALALFFGLRWAFVRFPGRLKRELDELKLRVATLEEVIAHLSRREGS